MKTKHLILLVAFLGMFVQVNAQTTSPTLEQTMSFISLKCMDNCWYLSQGIFEKGTGKDYKIGVVPNDKIYLKDKTLFVVSKESETNFQAELIISLNFVEGLSLEKDNKIRLYSSKQFFKINSSYKNDRPLYNDKNIYIGSFNEQDAPKVYKAFKHLLELLDVKLSDDMF